MTDGGPLAPHAARLAARDLDALPPTRPADTSGVPPRASDEAPIEVEPGIPRGRLLEVPSPP